MPDPVPPPATPNIVVRVLKRPLTWAILVLVAWWVVGAVAGPLAGRLQEVQKNDNAAFLPATAESTEVNQLQQKFAQTETFPLAVLFVRDGQVTSADQQYVAGGRRARKRRTLG